MFFKAKNGKIDIEDTEINYITFGEGPKSLVMIPGIGESLTSFKGLASPLALMYRKFAKEYKVYILSRRTKLPESFSTKDMANDVIKSMEILNIEKADLVGVSQGGMISQYVAITAPEKINKLVLIVTVARKNDILLDSVEKWTGFAKEGKFKELMMDTAERSYVGEYLDKCRKMDKLAEKIGKKITYDRFFVQSDSCKNHDSYAELHKIKCPTLIVGALKDKVLCIEGSLELAGKIINSELYIYDEYSHGVYEQAKDFDDRILNYLKK